MTTSANTVVEFRRYDLPVDFPMLLLEGDYWKISQVRNQRLHFHNFFEVGYCHSYDGTLVCDDVEVPFRAGDMTFIPPYFPHTTFSGNRGESRWTYLYLDLESFLNPFQELFPEVSFQHFLDHKYTILNREQSPLIYQLLLQLLKEARAPKDTSLAQEIFTGCLFNLFLLLSRAQKQIDQTPAIQPADEVRKSRLIIAPALQYIQSNYMNDFTIEFLADLCHISLTHFRRTFLDIMGDTPWNYVNTVRIEKASILLKTTDHANLTIAEMVGFRSISSYNNYFKRIMGVTPSEFRDPQVRTGVTPTKKSILEYRGWTRPEVLTEEEDSGS